VSPHRPRRAMRERCPRRQYPPRQGTSQAKSSFPESAPRTLNSLDYLQSTCIYRSNTVTFRQPSFFLQTFSLLPGHSENPTEHVTLMFTNGRGRRDCGLGDAIPHPQWVAHRGHPAILWVVDEADHAALDQMQVLVNLA